MATASDKFGPNATSESAPAAEEPTIGRLIADTTADLSALVRSEIELAKTELRFSVKAGGLGAALLAVAGFFGVLALIMVSVAAGYAIAYLPHTGLALGFLIVFVLYLLIAGVLALVGLKKLKQVRAPEKTIAAMKSNKQVLKRS
ncbi:MAG: phage holin family protein [Nocardioidaceae bacterium]